MWSILRGWNGKTFWNYVWEEEYSRIKSTKVLSFCTTTFSMSLTKLTALPPHWHNFSAYASRRILAPPTLPMQKNTDLHAHDFAHFLHSWRQPRLVNFTCALSWGLYGITSAVIKIFCLENVKKDLDVNENWVCRLNSICSAVQCPMMRCFEDVNESLVPVRGQLCY